jgi:hypothetical protein
MYHITNDKVLLLSNIIIDWALILSNDITDQDLILSNFITDWTLILRLKRRTLSLVMWYMLIKQSAVKQVSAVEVFLGLLFFYWL